MVTSSDAGADAGAAIVVIVVSVGCLVRCTCMAFMCCTAFICQDLAPMPDPEPAFSYQDLKAELPPTPPEASRPAMKAADDDRWC